MKMNNARRILLPVAGMILLATAFQNCAPGVIDYKYWAGSNVVKTGADSPNNCPQNYISVPALGGYTTKGFCVAKYEMRADENSMPVSQSEGTPWVSIARGIDSTEEGSAWKACRDLGDRYDLITNAQWQTIARNIAHTASNWSLGEVGKGELNRGHSDSTPAQLLEAFLDDEACFGTEQNCTDKTWDAQRRTHKLSNGAVIWDFSGSVWEWVQDSNEIAAGEDGFISSFDGGDNRQNKFGHDQFCGLSKFSPYCGFGIGYMNYNTGAILRGGSYSDDIEAGIFAANLKVSGDSVAENFGFRCVYNPSGIATPSTANINQQDSSE